MALFERSSLVSEVRLLNSSGISRSCPSEVCGINVSLMSNV